MIPGSLNKSIVLIDDECILCNSVARFIIHHDKKDLFRIGSLQSDTGKNLLKKYSYNGKESESVILISGNKLYYKSAAVLKIFSRIGGWWSLAKIFYIVPEFMRNFIYDKIAQSRHKVFGKRKDCKVPDEKEEMKFIS